MAGQKKKRHWTQMKDDPSPEPEAPRKKQLSKRTCLVCDAEKGINQCPSATKVSSHEHGPNVCRHCYFSHIVTEIESKNWDEVACSECPVVLTYHEVKHMASPEHFEKYEQASLRAALADDADYRHCFSTTCDAGQLHTGGTGEPIFSCQACGHKHCVACEASWHEEQTCVEFQATRQRHVEENEQSQQEVEKISKPCPGCRSPIQKNNGCDHMTCYRCRHQFCWICSADYRGILSKGNHSHEKDCKWYRSELSPAPRARAAREPEI